MAAERIQQLTMCCSIEQAAIVGLAMHFHECPADVASQLNPDCRIVEKSAAAAIRRNRTAQDDLARGILQAIAAHQGESRMPTRELENRRDDRLLCAGAHDSPAR